MHKILLGLFVVGLVGIALSGPTAAQGTPPGEQTQQQEQAQEPKYVCSISVPANMTNSQLASLTKIDAKRAEAAANAAVAGTLLGTKLEDENGCLVYSVNIKSADGKVHDVKVDAGNGKVVHQELQGTEKEDPQEEKDED